MQLMSIISFSVAMTALFISIIAGVLAFIAWSTVVGLKNSTHRIQYVPVSDPEFNKFSDKDLESSLDEDGNPIPLNGGDESTGLGLVNQFKKNIHIDDEEY